MTLTMTGKTLNRFLYAAVLVLIFLGWGCRGTKETAPLARHGVLDLSGWDLVKDGPVNLAGEWQFYWGQLLTPADFRGSRPPEITGYLTLPSAWNSFQLNGKKLGAAGYATLRLRILPGPGQADLALRLFNVASAYRLWLNGRSLAASGVVGRKAAAEIPKTSILLPQFHQERGPIELVLQVSNYHYRQGGVISAIQLGPQALMEAGHIRQWGLALFFVGGLLVMGAYHLVLFWFRRTNRAPLYFGLYCLLWLGNFLASDSSAWAIRLFWPQASMLLLEPLNLICFFLSVPVGYLFFRALYPEEFSTLILRFTAALAAGFVILALLASTLALTTALPVYYLCSCLLILYCLARLLQARRKGREEATFLLAGFLVLGLAGVNDMLFDLEVIRSVYLIQVGMFAFILFQAFALSRRFSRAFSSVERLSAELEEELLARTRAEAEARRAGQLAMLGELAAGIAHEVNTPINTIINSCELLLTADSREELEHDASIIRSEGRRIAGIVRGLLSFARRGQGEKSACPVARIVADTVSLVQAKLRQEQIRLLVEVPDDLPDVKANHQQMLQVALNLINNAAQALNDKYPEPHADKIIRLGGELVQTERGAMVRLAFHDQGPGIPARLLEQVLTPFFTTKPPGQGTGLGLSVAHGIINEHGGSLRLTSIEGVSTTVTIDLPVAAGD
jgi:signal transduction histidine kinase